MLLLNSSAFKTLYSHMYMFCRGHTSYVNCAIFTKDGSNTLTGSSDGSVRLWDSKTTESLLEFRLEFVVQRAVTLVLTLCNISCSRPGLSTNIMSVSRDIAVHTLRIMPNNSDHLLVCMKCPQALIMTVQGQVVKSFSSGKQSGGDFLCATTSPQGIKNSLNATFMALQVTILLL